MWTNRTPILMLLSSVATAALMSQASALEAQAFVDRVATVWKTQGYDLQFGPATLDGDTITVDGVTVTIIDPVEVSTDPMVLDTEITFSGVSEGADGSYTAQTITIPDIDSDFSADPIGHITLSDIRLNGFYLPGGDTISAIESMQWLESASTGPLSITRDGEEVIAVKSMETVTTFNPSQNSAELVGLDSSFTINGITVDLSTVSEEDPEAGAIIDALGLTSIAGDISSDMTWTMADGQATINQFLFDFADIGALDLRADVTGLTPAVLDQIMAMQTDMAADGEMTDEKAQAQMMSGMAIMQGVSIVGASVRYDDASLAGKLLDFFAAESGADRASFVAGLKSTLPMMVGQSGIPALKDIVVPPVEAFLDNPESLEIRIAPPSPTSVLVVMAAAANPAGLIKALGLVVEANTPAQ